MITLDIVKVLANLIRQIFEYFLKKISSIKNLA